MCEILFNYLWCVDARADPGGGGGGWGSGAPFFINIVKKMKEILV